MSAFLKERATRSKELLERHDLELSNFDLQTIAMGIDHVQVLEASAGGLQDDDIASVRGSMLSLVPSASRNSFSTINAATTTSTSLWSEMRPDCEIESMFCPFALSVMSVPHPVYSVGEEWVWFACVYYLWLLANVLCTAQLEAESWVCCVETVDGRHQRKVLKMLIGRQKT